jgi:hypothetical protein
MISQDFAICPWCGGEDSGWPEYHTKDIRLIQKLVCDFCRKPYLVIETVDFVEIPVCEHDKKRFGEFLSLPICNFETRKIILQKDAQVCPSPEKSNDKNIIISRNR